MRKIAQNENMPKPKVIVKVQKGQKTSPSPTNIIVSAPKTQKRKKRKNRGPKRMGGFNPRYLYAYSLHNPWGIRGARIPDERVYPTATITSVLRLTLPALNCGTAGYNAGIMFNVGNLTPASVDACLTPAIVVNSGLDFTLGSCTAQPFPNKASISGACSRLRPVSAGLAVYATSASTVTQGKFQLVQYPDFSTRPSGTYGPAGFQSTFPAVKVCPIRNGEVCCIAWRPNKPTDYEFVPPGNYTGIDGQQLTGGLAMYASGLVAGVSLEVVVVCNWEVIASAAYDTIIYAAPSPYDVKALEMAINSCQGSDMFTSYPQSVFDATANNFQSSNTGVLAGVLSSLDEGVDSLTEMIHSGMMNLTSAGAAGYRLARLGAFGYGVVSGVANRLGFGGGVAGGSQAPQSIMYG